jgi:hypothetical protein
MFAERLLLAIANMFVASQTSQYAAIAVILTREVRGSCQLDVLFPERAFRPEKSESGAFAGY